MKPEYENLQSTIKRKYSFKYNPEFSETFKTELKESQIIPLIIEVFEKLEWPIVHTDKNSVEAKRKGDFNSLTEKVIITKKSTGRIEVLSKTIKGNFIDFGKNSKRTGLFIKLFKKLELEYQINGKITELESAYEKQNSWEDYEIPTELPKPKQSSEPNLSLSITGGITTAIIIGLLLGFVTIKFTHIIGLYEIVFGIILGYLFGQILKKTNYINYRNIQYIIGVMVLITFLTSQYLQYQLIILENNIQGLGFFELMKIRLEKGMVLNDSNTGWIGLVISWGLQIVFLFFVALTVVTRIAMNYMIEKIPNTVIEYTIYLFEMDKSESEVRALLAQKGWNNKNDQDDIFEALGAISGFHENNRE